MRSESQEMGPVFVIGMNGSGTTMLSECLGRHPEVYAMPMESKVLPYYLRKFGKLGQAGNQHERQKLALSLGREKPFWQANGKSDVLVSHDDLVRSGFYGIVDAVYRRLMNGSEKKIWCDRSPINSQYVSDLAAAFPDARFLHIIRDGRDAAQSFHRRWGQHPLHTIYRWKLVVGEARRQAATILESRYLEIRYEDLTANPCSAMMSVCAFLDLRFDELVLESSMKYMDPSNVEANSGRIVGNSNKWREYFLSADVEAMERIAGRLLVDCGYAANELGDMGVPRTTIVAWQIRDQFAFAKSFFAQYGLWALPMYLRRSVSALKQRSTAKF